MKLRQRGLVAAILMATLVVSPLVEAKRAGSGKSQGMQRSVAPSQSRQQAPLQQQRVPQQAPIAAQQKTGSNTGKMIAAGVAGAAVGAIAANALADDKTATHSNTATASASQPAEVKKESAQQPEEKKSGIPSWIWLILIAGAAFFIFRKMGAKKKLENSNPYAPNSGGTATSPFGQNNTQNTNSNIYGQSVGGGSVNSNTAPFATNNTGALPDGTEQSAFLRIARQRFNHIQSMNTASNIEEIRRYLTSDLYNSMYQDIMANRDQDVAEFQNLNAELADTATENGQYIASVRFTGLVSEDLNSQPQPFTEVWHFVKPINTQQDWLVAGIQVES
ncbi:Tim44 domain-containing protein [Acinetobacter rathckeae]|uniref:Tim44 domain-containing protein n=1 Tax=Acinetobacter rathckeae TaxID=2605272 RepID=UPI0018A297CB|nr:Tim44-like domain-containing protein [Acinetobacter rathckeae]MBF7687413.1 Tim44 domain-containing protein [Acinetobacter rathckeae]MBF7694814.1 Tim44 domain-containing protein [Acinetobacter rathckeae]